MNNRPLVSGDFYTFVLSLQYVQLYRRDVMDIAGLSVVMANQEVRRDASFAMMSQIKNVMTNQGEQLAEMLQQSTASVPHPTHGHYIDLKG